MADDYEVGYGKPPVHTQFKKGVPQPGRRRKSSGIDVCAFFDEKVTVVIDGAKRKIDSYEIALTNLAKKAIQGNMPAAKRFIDLCDGAALLEQPTNGHVWPSVLKVPVDYDDQDEFWANCLKFGPPPWPLEHDGMPRIEEYRNGLR